MDDKKNMNLSELSEQLMELAKIKEDRVASAENVYTFIDKDKNYIKFGMLENDKVIKETDITDGAHRNINLKLDMNCWKYYQKMKEEKPELLVKNINEWINEKSDKSYLFRFLDDKLRAMLSDSFLIADHDIVWKAAQESLIDMQKTTDIKLNVEKFDASVTDDHLYIKVTSKDLLDEICPKRKNGKKAKGDLVNGGVVIKNSETGLGRWSCEPFLMILECVNGYIGTNTFARTHIGHKLPEGLIKKSDETRMKELEALMSSFKDVISQTFTKATFSKMIDLINEKGGEKLEEPQTAINQVVKKYRIPEESNELLLNYLLEEGENADIKFGLAQAVTRIAHNPEVVKKYEDQIRLERAGMEIINTPMKQIIRGF